MNASDAAAYLPFSSRQLGTPAVILIAREEVMNGWADIYIRVP